MKRHHLYCCSAVLLATSAANVHAQTTVQLYGLIDIGVNYLSNVQTAKTANGWAGNSVYSMTEGGARGLFGSRVGFTGSEDLGGGLSAIFTLENGFGAANGAIAQGGAMFGRQAFVGLSSRDYGTVTLGRGYDTMADFVGPLTPVMFAGISGNVPGDVDGLARTRRTNGAIKYVSPTFGGFTFGAMYSPGGQAGNITGKQVWSLATSYVNGGATIALGYFNARSPNLSIWGTDPSAGTTSATDNLGVIGSATAVQTNPIYSGYASARTYEVYSGGAKYVWGKTTVGITLSHVGFKDLGDLAAGPNPYGYAGTAVFNNATAVVSYLLDPAWQIGAAYTYTHGGGAGGNDGATYHQGIAGVRYSLSKRTELYALATYMIASGTDSTGQSAVAGVVLMTPSSDNHQFMGRVGMVHRF